ncbi:Rieske (2Fe-2S) protein [Ralstonia flatus]|uniref:Naphthalene 1,2-dioxygenase/salicylate 5-hydroxylase systems, ferredoxin component n=1 Tax=Ralstonia flatus TaxID=3058601 RepID=A0AAD2C4E9_9RALS|nr:Rieske 2Fe-2S domain-containing protein [Ralstonia sp. LMG 32965]MBN6208767.1 Rieske 2Fe-2S domain-containing protein [Ralstonia pickettii]CAJ0853154.1 Naphthalene 1,2-dioxygenase/salicylate 5-hydroxylase systems, ferredoxin component [Ralstonia sp. LMG 32965]CAJ0866642.1 Naphthalene 1,2-dioxygenase/salicylate 5-hydroxylase systems, ferredoxin component [Ralstonia sp. LMG 32965]
MARNIIVTSASHLPAGQRKLVFANGRSIVVFNVEGRLHAVDNSCPHNGASLASGRLDGNVLQCPAHGLRFNLATGCVPGAGGLCLKTYAIHEADGHIVIQLDDDA